MSYGSSTAAAAHALSALSTLRALDALVARDEHTATRRADQRTHPRYLGSFCEASRKPDFFLILPAELMAAVFVQIDPTYHFMVKLACKSFSVCLHQMHEPASSTSGAHMYRTKTSLFQIKLTPTLRTWATSIYAQDLAHHDWEVRSKAMHTMFYGLGMDAVALHGDTFIRFLTDAHMYTSATVILRHLEPGILSRYAKSVVLLLAHPIYATRRCAVELMGVMSKVTLVEHADAVVKRLRDDHCSVRLEAIRVLCELEPVVLAVHARAVIRTFIEDDDYSVRCGAELALRKLDRSTIRITRETASVLQAAGTYRVCKWMQGGGR